MFYCRNARYMGHLRDLLLQLQNKPYPEKLRLLRWVVFWGVILVVIIWIVTLQLRKPSVELEGPKPFEEVFENLKNLRTK